MRKSNFLSNLFTMSSIYKLSPNKLGCTVRGIDLTIENRPQVIQQIKEDVIKHRILIFKDQGIVSGNRHVEISEWFGELESTFYKHPKSPHPDVFRVSNDKSEGCTGVGRTGWHIDGSFQPAPFAYSLYHMVSVPKRGATAFAPLTEIVESLPNETFSKWNRLWMMSDRRSGPIHPLIYKHPKSGKKGCMSPMPAASSADLSELKKRIETVVVVITSETHTKVWKELAYLLDVCQVTDAHIVLCFHLGMTTNYVYDYGSPNQREATRSEFEEISKEIHHEFVKDDGKIQYVHQWEPGDFIISDNLAVAHEATPETQIPRSEVGLRVLHRTTIKGTVPPSK